MTPPESALKPNDRVVIKYDCGEYYADYPSQIILSASKGSTGRIASLDEFKIDFIQRLGKHSPSQDQKQSYLAHFAVVQQAMAFGLQYPILFEEVKRPAYQTDVLLAMPNAIELVDGAAVEKVASSSGSGFNPITSLFGHASKNPGPVDKIVWPPTKPVHDQAKFTDFELAIVMSNPKPATRQEIEFVYSRYLSTLPYHNLWFRLKQVVAEAAFDIMDTLHFPKHNHAGYSWEQISDMLDKNNPRSSLWYTAEQREALIVAAQKIYQLENQGGLH